MGFEARRNGNLYYYQKRRDGNRVVSEYGGSGKVADFAERRAEIDRRHKQQEREQARAERMSLIEIDKTLDTFGSMVDTLMTAELLMSGYHQHKRQWRRRRNG